jgi:hypothetical protein
VLRAVLSSPVVLLALRAARILITFPVASSSSSTCSRVQTWKHERELGVEVLLKIDPK